ncbi:hypothetical protein EVAR_18629_1 [Eumeta japonica]|uniref:Secreted protein n=1 Tax=Eumeta variegata TaxID=151549 RepID=A0A4C1U6V0_EUMVA|nr:hypothetical protein EVAR_18629_1 [Eumeta japonica]
MIIRRAHYLLITFVLFHVSPSVVATTAVSVASFRMRLRHTKRINHVVIVMSDRFLMSDRSRYWAVSSCGHVRGDPPCYEQEFATATRMALGGRHRYGWAVAASASPCGHCGP